ncbi:MAG: hypothetical protein HY710_05930 [Candidatus Latescibacteria bacterium]|nr:hypothetical protein [Candidatus Latescibacterota bacterium]
MRWLVGLLIAGVMSSLSVSWRQAPVKDELVYGGGLVPRGLNPLLEKNDWSEVSCLILSRLFQIDEQGQLLPDLVERYTVSPDGLTYTFVLRRNVVWHDGVPFTPEDVRFTFDMIFAPNTKTAYDADLSMVKTYAAKAPDTFIVILSAPSSSFLSKLSDPPILPRHILDGQDINGEAFEKNPVGTGPYTLIQKVSDREWVFERNARFHLSANPTPIKRILLRIVPDDDERARMAAAGAFHITQVKPQHIAMLKQNPDLAVYRFPSGAWRGMPQNLRRSFIQDRRVRQAISHAIDREVIVKEALMGAGQAAYLPVPPGSPVYDPSLFKPGRDVARAKALLAEAGWKPGPDGILQKDGQRFEYRIGIWKDEIFRRLSGDLIKRQLAEVGIPVDLDLVDNTRYQQIGDDMGTTHDTIIGGWSGLLDPDMNLSKKFSLKGSQNYMKYTSPDVDRLLERGRTIAEPAQRKAVYRELLTILRDDAVFIPLVYPDYVFVAQKNVRGLRDGMTVDSWYHFTRNAYKWSLAE